MDRFFIGLEPIYSGINAVEFTANSPVGYVTKLGMAGDMVPIDCFMETSHPNLVNLREVFVTENSLFFVYEKWGISLKEILLLSPVFQLGEVEVATICREVLKGLRYIHKTIGISHGSLSESNIHIMEDGDVKIANIGKSMVTNSGPKGMSRDIKDVCKLARLLLGSSDAPATRGTVGVLASDFAHAPSDVTIDELLQAVGVYVQRTFSV
ncbi:hypothetical protein EYZ11_012328 [Aspergillus tanneri]|uniref:Protein kinase domain-containing protein n=1 Tax=Aspergillus tanneri TaxID=1220188 RepID=A0A4V3UMQ8_9EURO|nr:hypothetical protein EYZ11_012328 [Aspergillus tanneri]